VSGDTERPKVSNEQSAGQVKRDLETIDAEVRAGRRGLSGKLGRDARKLAHRLMYR
jgi:hypothetical protein